MKILPLITEKSMSDAKEGKYTFNVDPNMVKGQIKELVNKVFGVHVTSVRTILYKGRVKKNFRGIKINVPARKKTIVTLKDKEKIDLFETKEGKKK